MKGAMKFFTLAFGLILGLLTVSTVFAETWYEPTANIDKMTVYVNGNAVWHGFCEEVPEGGWECNTFQYATPALERDSSMSIRVVFSSTIDLSDVRLKAWIYGYRDDIEDTTRTFDVFEGVQYTKTLTLQIPEDIDAKDDYTLYVKIEHKKELTGVSNAEIDTIVQRINNKLKILNIDLWSYQNGFKAGTTIYADVVVKNIGNHLAEDVFIKATIPKLGIGRTVYVGDIGSYDNGYDDTVKKTIALTLPEDAEVGSYKLEIKVYNSELSVEGTKSFMIVEEKAEEAEEAKDEKVSDKEVTPVKGIEWESVAMVISIILAVAIIVLLVFLLVKQKGSSEEKPEEAESYY